MLPRWGWAGRQWTSGPIFAVYKGYPIFIETEQTKSFCLPQAFLPMPPPPAPAHLPPPPPLQQCPLTKPEPSFSEISGLGRLGEGVTWEACAVKTTRPVVASLLGQGKFARKEGTGAGASWEAGIGMWYVAPPPSLPPSVYLPSQQS